MRIDALMSFFDGRRIFFVIENILFCQCHVMFCSFFVCRVWLQTIFVAAGAHVALVETLQVHQGHAGVAEKACIALRWLTLNNAAHQVTSTGGKQDPVGGGGG